MSHGRDMTPLPPTKEQRLRKTLIDIEDRLRILERHVGLPSGTIYLYTTDEDTDQQFDFRY